MIDATELLCRALETEEAWEWPETCAAEYEELLKQKLIRETASAKFRICPHCQEAIVINQLTDGSLYSDCEDGRVFFSQDSIRRWRPNALAIIALIRNALSLSGTEAELIEGKLYLLGSNGAPSRAFPIWLFRGGDEPTARETAYTSLARRSPAEAGVIVTSSHHVHSQAWPRGSKAILLQDLIKLNENGLDIIPAVIFSNAPEGIRHSEKQGRPPKNELNVVQTFLDRIGSGDAVTSTCKDEAREIAEIERKRFGDEARKLGQIQKVLGPYWKNWKNTGFDRAFKQ